MVISGKKKNYKDDFYADGTKLFCIVCKHVVDHKQKSTIDNHLETPYVFLCIENTKNLLRAGIENPPLNQSMIDLCRIQNVSEESLIPRFSQAFITLSMTNCINMLTEI
ncbi:4194_t:CDS:2 [Entrophospora sp. SA101]|nr:4194_t:CDS:2 [Entrophospora sp. SA101]